jgi:hypothetical protein
MIKTRILIIVIVMLSFTLLKAHPASDVTVTFDKETSLLTVEFVHKVNDADKHFIFEVTVYLNKDEIITQSIEKQDTLDGGSLVYKIVDAKAGDKIKVKTNCNKSGKKSGELELE